MRSLLNNPTSSNSRPIPLETLIVDRLSVQIYASPEEVALAASVQARQILVDAIEARGQANAIFATGRSQVAFLSHLTHTDRSPVIDWSKITGFHLDEYLGIAASHPASFRHYLQKHLTSQVSLAQWHDIKGDGLLPLDICQHYENLLRENPADLCCLGIGNNGHLAFNDPAVANFTDPYWVKLVRLDDQNRQQQVSSSAFTSLEEVPQYAFTLTLSAIQAAGHNLCLANGESKSAIIHKMLTGSVSSSCPASILRQTAQAQLLIDSGAASSFLK